MLKIKTGKEKKSHLICVYGEGGVGKTTFASQFPNPLFICAESGLGELDFARLEIKDLSEFYEALNLTGSYETIVIDSLDWLEGLVYQAIMKKYNVDVITKAAGGYGAYIGVVVNTWQDIIKRLSDLRISGKNIVLVSHFQVKSFNDPILEAPYDRYQLKLQDKVAALIKEWVDILMFAKFETFVSDSGSTKKNKAVSTGNRIACVYPDARFEAKTRFKMPESFEFSYGSFVNALNKSTEDLSQIKNEIQNLMATITDEDIKGKALKCYNEYTNYEQFQALKKRLEILTGDKK